jgi:hypothetical protein
MRIVVTGLIGQYAFGGVAWDYIQYALGFQALGHDVWYLEDTATWPYDPVREEPSADCSRNVAYLDHLMRYLDMGDRWIYRNEPDGKYYGITNEKTADKIIAEADILVNVSGACWLRSITAKVKLKFFLDGDPMFTQIRLTRGSKEYLDRVLSHEKHFTFGLNVGRSGCRVPTLGLAWRPTVQPVALDWWEKIPLAFSNAGHLATGAWTTVMQWSSYESNEYEGDEYGQKDVEFLRFCELPTKSTERFVVAMGRGPGNKPTEYLESAGWKILEPSVYLPDYATYRDFLLSSKAEWSIAKNGYVKSNCGWFSCRSACYLAAGKPVVVQDTGWSHHLPSGDGVLAFRTMEDAVARIDDVTRNYEHHCQAAKKYAKTHFDAANVCAELLERGR